MEIYVLPSFTCYWRQCSIFSSIDGNWMLLHVLQIYYNACIMCHVVSLYTHMGHTEIRQESVVPGCIRKSWQKTQYGDGRPIEFGVYFLETRRATQRVAAVRPPIAV
jgi:hypothetical protein